MILIIGIPNAGKTTYAAQYSDVVHYDDTSRLPREERLSIAAKSECAEGIYNTRKSRTEILKKAGEGRHVCVWIDTPIEICLERERNGRMRGDGLVLHHAKRFEPPTYDEGWDEIKRIRVHKNRE